MPVKFLQSVLYEPRFLAIFIQLVELHDGFSFLVNSCTSSKLQVTRGERLLIYRVTQKVACSLLLNNCVY